MPSPPEGAVSRCPLCSMCCPVGVEVDGLGHVKMRFPADSGFEEGACSRGLAASHLLRSDHRIYEASVEGKQTTPEDGLEHTAAALESYDPSEVAVLLDAYRPLESLAEAADAVAGAMPEARVCTAPPPGDRTLADAGLGPTPPAEDIEDTDLLLAVGDPFSTHPPLSRPARNMQMAGREHRIMAVSTAATRTGLAADSSITVHPSQAAALMCAVAVECGAEDVSAVLDGADADEICEQSGTPREAIEEVSGALEDADSAAVLLGNPNGHFCHSRAVVRATVEAARAADAAMYPLFGCPGARSPAGNDTLPGVLEAMRAGGVRAAVVAGFDPMGRMAPDMWGERADELEFVAYATPLRTRFAREADVVLPMALPWEEGGSLEALGEGVIYAPAWASLPEGVLDMSALLEGLARHMDSNVSASGNAELAEPDAVEAGEMAGEAIFRSPRPGDGHVTVVGEAEVYADGNSSALEASSWTRRMGGREKVIMSAETAEELGVEEGDPVSLGNGAVTMPCGVREGMPGGVVAAPSHREEVKRLLQWRVTEDSIEAGPAEVSIQSAE